mmetsp:Transcript_2552/g.6412  ORF Transcript_2552/g.6412 Transcript_2552/m.6412 type:complete len:265 (-) Transcript_2552:758-1552(-)
MASSRDCGQRAGSGSHSKPRPSGEAPSKGSARSGQSIKSLQSSWPAEAKSRAPAAAKLGRASTRTPGLRGTGGTTPGIAPKASGHSAVDAMRKRRRATPSQLLSHRKSTGAEAGARTSTNISSLSAGGCFCRPRCCNGATTKQREFSSRRSPRWHSDALMIRPLPSSRDAARRTTVKASTEVGRPPSSPASPFPRTSPSRTSSTAASPDVGGVDKAADGAKDAEGAATVVTFPDGIKSVSTSASGQLLASASYSRKRHAASAAA